MLKLAEMLIMISMFALIVFGVITAVDVSQTIHGREACVVQPTK